MKRGRGRKKCDVPLFSPFFSYFDVSCTCFAFGKSAMTSELSPGYTFKLLLHTEDVPIFSGRVT